MSKSRKKSLIPTLNNKGYSPTYPDIIQKAFIRFAGRTEKPVLDIGAAFGVASLSALKKGAKVIANDIEIRHLKAIEQNVPSFLLKNINFLVGRMPQDLEFIEGSLGAVIVSRVLHFMTPQEVTESMNKIYRWLTPGGNFFFVASTPYIKILENFLPTYNQRKNSGELWPGLVQDVKEYLSMPVDAMPPFIHLMDKDLVNKIFVDAGFNIINLDYFAAECPQEWLYDGREFIGCIAKKG